MWRCRLCKKHFKTTDCDFLTNKDCFAKLTLKITPNKYTRYLTLKSHLWYVWNDAYGQREIARRHGRLTKKDYCNVYNPNWGKRGK